MSAPPFLERSPQYDSRSDAGVAMAVFHFLLLQIFPAADTLTLRSVQPLKSDL